MFEFLKKAAQQAADGGKASLQSTLYMLQHPQFLWYPFLHIFSIIMVLLLWFGTIVGLVALKGHSKIALFVLSLLTVPYFAFVFFSSLSACATTYYAIGHFNNDPITVSESYIMAFKKTGMLLKWMIINTFVKFLVKAGTGRQLRLFSIGALLDLSWTMTTFFIFPIIATKETGIVESMKESYTLMKENFGLNSGALITFSLVRGVVGRTIFSFCFFIATLGIMIFQPEVATNFYHFIHTVIKTGSGTLDDFTLVRIIFTIGVISIVIPSALMATARAIFKTAVYQFTQDKPSGPFNAHTIKTVSQAEDPTA